MQDTCRCGANVLVKAKALGQGITTATHLGLPVALDRRTRGYREFIALPPANVVWECGACDAENDPYN